MSHPTPLPVYIVQVTPTPLPMAYIANFRQPTVGPMQAEVVRVTPTVAMGLVVICFTCSFLAAWLVGLLMRPRQ